MCDHQEKESKRGKPTSSKSQHTGHHHKNQGHHHHHYHHPYRDKSCDIVQDFHLAGDKVSSEHHSTHQIQCDDDKTLPPHRHRYHHKPKPRHVSLSETSSGSTSTSSLVSSSFSSSSSLSTSSSSSSSSSSSFSSSSTSSSTSSLLSSSSSECSDRPVPQHSQSCTDIPGKHKHFEEGDDTVPLLNEGGHLNMSSAKEKLSKSSHIGPIRRTSKSKQTITRGLGNDGSFRKAKSMEDLTTPKDKEGTGSTDEKEQERNKMEAKKNMMKEKMKFSAFLNEITRQVLSPMRLTSLGVTDAQRPSSPRQVPARSKETDSGTEKPGQQRSRPTSADSDSSSIPSHTSKHSHTSGRSHSKSSHHNNHHSPNPHDHGHHRPRTCHSCSPSHEHHSRLPFHKNHHPHHHRLTANHSHHDHEGCNRPSHHQHHKHHRSPVNKDRAHYSPTHHRGEHQSGTHRDDHHGHGHEHHHGSRHAHHQSLVSEGHHMSPYHHEECHSSGHNKNNLTNSRPTTPHQHGCPSPTGDHEGHQGPTNQHHHSDHTRGPSHLQHKDIHHPNYHYHHGDQYTEEQHSPSYRHHSRHHRKESQHHHGDHHEDHHDPGQTHHHRDLKSDPQGHHHRDHHSPGHHHHHAEHQTEAQQHHHGDHHSETHQNHHHHHHNGYPSVGHHHPHVDKQKSSNHHHSDHQYPGHHHHQDHHNEVHQHPHGSHHNPDHHHGDHNSGPHHDYHRDHHSEAHHHHHGDHHSEAHHHHHGDHHSEAAQDHHEDHHNETNQHPHRHYHGSGHQHHHGDCYNTSHHQDHHPDSQPHHEHVKNNNLHQECLDGHHTFIAGHPATNPHEKSECLLNKQDSPTNIHIPSSPHEEQTSFPGPSPHKETTHEVGRTMSVQDQNEGLQQSLLKSAVRMECLGEEFISSQKLVETELHKTRMELSDLMEKFSRLHETCSSTQQTNNLLERKLQSVAENMEGERVRLNQRISELTEQLTDAKIASSMEVTSVLHKINLHSQTDGAIIQVIPSIAPPPAEFMDSQSYGNDNASVQEQHLGSVPEEEESDWSEVGEDTPQFILTGSNRGQAWRRQEIDMDKDNESGGEDVVRPHSPRPLQIPHLQFTIHNDFMQPSHTSSFHSGFANLSDNISGEESYRITKSPNLGSLLIRSASLEEIPLAHHHMQKELRGTEAMMDLHHSADETIEVLDNEIIHHWRMSNARGTVIRGMADSSLSGLQSAEQMLTHLLCDLPSSHGREPGTAEVHGWSGGIPEEVLKGERTQL